ncbi:hypothetical protein T439DRAFT_326495 [Meredithblackwellia eburnea MCA 4105]
MSSCGDESAGLPEALLEYLDSSFLPTLAWTHPINPLNPSFTNNALRMLLDNRKFALCLPEDATNDLCSFLGHGGGDRVPWDDILDLGFIEPSRGTGGSINSASIRWRASRMPQYTILVAEPVQPAFIRWPSKERKGHKGQVLPPLHQLTPDDLKNVAAFATEAPVGIFATNMASELYWANEEWWRVTGLDREVEARNWMTRVHPQDLPRLQQFRAFIEANPQNSEIEFRWKTSDKVEAWCISKVSVISKNGEPVGFLSAISNISKQKTAELAGLREREAMRVVLRRQEEEIRLESAHSAEREQAIQEQTREFALMSKFSSVGLVKIDLKGHFHWANAAWFGITKLPEDEDLDQWIKLVHPDDVKDVLVKWEHCLDTFTPFNTQFRWVNEDSALMQAQPNNPDHKKATGWIGSLTDVTAQSKAEQAILAVSQEREVLAHKAAQDAEARRQVAVEEKRQQELLVDTTSHELRNPISAILGNAQLTRSSMRALRDKFCQLDPIPPVFPTSILDDLMEDIEALESIADCAMAQERIANDILGLAQISLRRYNITPVSFELLASLRSTIRMFKNECKSKAIELNLELGCSLDRLGPHARVLADPTRLTQVLINLLSNAIRFTARSTVRKVTLAVEVSAAPPAREGSIVPPEETEYQIQGQKPIYLFFSVIDTGPGMSEEASAGLFKKFMQASPLTHVEMGGSGLGLWIARNLCELQLGRVEVKSTLGKGSTFRCFITAKSVDTGPASPHDKRQSTIEAITGVGRPADSNPMSTLPSSSGSPSATPVATPSKPQPKGLKLLCCEDNQVNRTILKKQLSNAGHEVILACDGQEGLDALAVHGPSIDCILMDIEMPVKDGLTATRDIREMERLTLSQRVRIVGLTGNARKAQVEDALKAGMDTVVTKPYRVEHLLAEIAKAREGEASTI